MTRHDEGTIGEPAKPKGKNQKKVSPARNAIGVVLLVSLSTVAYLEWSANRRSGAAISKLNEILGKEEGDLLSMKEVEDLIGRKPDGPAIEENGVLKVTYTWKGVFRQYPLFAIYRNQSPPMLLRIGMADGKAPPAVGALTVEKPKPSQKAIRPVIERRRRKDEQERKTGSEDDDRKGGEAVRLRPFASGATARVGSYMPQPLRLKSDRPAELTKAPELAAPLFGVIALGRESRPAAWLWPSTSRRASLPGSTSMRTPTAT
jgi:hypothetical protein